MKKSLIYPLGVLMAAYCRTKGDHINHLGNKSALEEIKKEPKVMDAFITEVNVLYVAVENTGLKRDGLAQYFTEILHDHKASCKWVKIIEFGTDSERYGFGKLLGEARITH